MNINKIGKNKKAIASALISKGKGIIRINKINLEVFSNLIVREKIKEPIYKYFKDTLQNININVKVSGGGVMGQMKAITIAICKSLTAFEGDKEKEMLIKKEQRDLLVNDVRMKKRKVQLGWGARAKHQKSYR